MTDEKLDIDFVKQNLDQKNLLSQVAEASLKALATTAVIIGAIFSVLNVSKLSEGIQLYVYTAIISGIGISLLLSIQYYYGKLFGLFEVFYTPSIDGGENFIALTVRTGASLCLAMLVAITVYIFQSDIVTLEQIAGCSFVSTTFIFYVFRNKLTDLHMILRYLLIGVSTGVAAYLLGSGIVIAIGLIGFWATVGILSLEVVFTAVYTYLGLLDWVKQEKDRRKNKEEWDEIHRRDAEAKELINRMAP